MNMPRQGVEVPVRHREVLALRWFAMGLLVATAIAASLRLFRLDRPSFWVDELKTIQACAVLPELPRAKLFGYLPTRLGLQAHGVRFERLSAETTHLWRSEGVTERSARFASCLIGVISVPLLALATAGWIGRRSAVVLALLLAVAPWHIYWSQAARFYTQQFMFYNLALIWYFQATRLGSLRRLTAAALMLLLAFLSQPTALVLGAVLALDWLLAMCFREPIRVGRVGRAAVFAVGVLVVAVVACDISRNPRDWTQFAGQIYQSPMKVILGTVYMVGPVVLLFALLTALRLFREDRRLAAYLFLAAVLPTVIFSLASLVVYVGLRYTFISLYAWLVLAAVGSRLLYDALRPQLGAALATAPLAMLVTASLVMNYGYYTGGAGFHPRWRDAFAYVADRRRAGENVISSHRLIASYYLEDPDVAEVSVLRDETAALAPAWIVMEMEDTVRGQTNAWLAEVAQLRARLDLQVIQPVSSVQVYYVPEPPRPTPVSD